MQYEIGYTTFEGASGSTQVIAENLPLWLAARPGTVIRTIDPIASLDVSTVHREIKKQALKEFAEGILRNC